MSNKIKGLTIEIGGNTQPLNKALGDVNKKSRDLQSELRQVERLLKLDPKNTELLAQKQKLLAEAIQNSGEKLNKLKEAQIQVNEQFKRGEVSEDQYRAFQREVIKAEQELEKFERQLKETSFSAEKLGKSLQDAGQKMTGVGKDLSMKVTAPIVAVGAASYKMAADLEDAMGATDQIYKASAEAIKQWASQLESYYGIAEGEALEYANMMGTMLVNIGGLTEEQASKQAQTLIELAGDLTAMYGGTTTDAVRALTGALKGNNTMLDNYGMAANDALIKTKAMEMGLYSGTGQMDLATKQAATLALIMEQSGAAQGQAAREAEGASGSMRAFATEVKNLSGEIGKELLPVITPLISSAKGAAEAFGELSPETKKMIITIAGIVAAVGPVLVGLGMLTSSLGSIIAFFAAGGTAATIFGGTITVLTGPIGLVIAAIGLLVAAGITLYKNWDEAKAYTIKAVESIKVAVLRISVQIIETMEKIYGWIPVIGDAVKANAERARKALEDETVKMEKAKKAWRDLQSPDTSMGAFRQLDQESIKKTTAGLGAVSDTLKDEVIPSFDGAGKSVSAAGKTMKSTAETTKAAWEITTESLKSRMSQIKLSFEITGNQLDMTGDKAQQLKNDMDSLTSQIDVQRQVIEATVEGYEQMKIEKGENSEEAQRLKVKVLEEQKALSDLQKQLFETTNALKDHAQEFRDLATEVGKIEKKYKYDLVSALDDYQKKVEAVNQKVREDERRTTEEYNRAVDERTRALSNFVGLFDQVAKRDISGEDLLANLQGQVDAFENWSDDIQALAERGVDEGLIDELRQMGPKAGPEIAALNTLTDEQLIEYVSLWKTKNQEAREEAVNQLQQQRVEMQQKLMEIRQSANEQLELYRVEWEKKNAEIRKNAEDEMNRIQEKFESIANAGTTYGVALMSNFIGGMESQFGRLRETLLEMAMTVDSYMPHSPAKVGPLRRLAEWGPALIETFAGGILANLPKLENAMNKMALSMVPVMLDSPVDKTNSTTNNDYGGNIFHIHVSGGDAREQAEDIIREIHRLGIRF